MAFHEVFLNENAIDVAVIVVRAKEPTAFIAVLHNNSVSLYEWQLMAKPASPSSLKWFKKISCEGQRRCMLQQVDFNGEKALSVLTNTADGSAVYALERMSGTIDKGLFFSKTDFKGLVRQVARTDSENCLLLQATSVVSPSNWIGGFEVVQMLGLLPDSSPRVEIVSFQNQSVQATRSPLHNGDHRGNDIRIFGLSDTGVLFVNERVLARNCTSFLVTPAHLIFTTGQHLLKFVHMNKVEGR